MPEARFITRARREDFAFGAENGAPRIEGYFVRFNEPYYIDDFMEEIVLPGAFDGCDMTDVRALIDHQPHLVLGRNTADTLTLRVDDTIGLFASIKINSADIDAGNLYARVQRHDVDQASFGFDEQEVRYIDLPDGRVRREIASISKLWEVSVCTFPAYESTYVEARDRSATRITQELRARKKTELKRRLIKCRLK